MKHRPKAMASLWGSTRADEEEMRDQMDLHPSYRVIDSVIPERCCPEGQNFSHGVDG